MHMDMQFHATTICAVRHNGKGAIAGDGQVTFGNSMVMKHHAKKVRRLYRGQVVAGFAGSVADAITLFEKFEGKLEEHHGNLQRAAVELAKDWRSDRVLRKLGSDDDRHGCDAACCSSPETAKSSSRMTAFLRSAQEAASRSRQRGRLKQHAPHMEAKDMAKSALEIAADICVFTNRNIIVEEIE